jgi:hypothetical protein
MGLLASLLQSPVAGQLGWFAQTQPVPSQFKHGIP